MTVRLRCIVPFCKRTRGQRKGERPISEGEDWICGEHWRLLSPSTRAANQKVLREARRICARKPAYRCFWTMPPGSSDRLAAVALWRRVDAAWERCKREAIERAGGII